jgi:hypothetical protein
MGHPVRRPTDRGYLRDGDLRRASEMAERVNRLMPLEV